LFVFYQRKQRSGSARAVQRLEGEMQHYLRLGGIAAIALAAAALSACYPPPDTIAAAPAPWTPPPAYVPQPTATTPLYPPAGTFAPQPYGPTTPPGALSSNAGATFAAGAPFPPPPPRVETPPPPPSSMAIWRPGHWSWSGGQYVWIGGQYAERPAPSANWVPGYWQQGPNGWIWVEGRWA
jgi:hypothetical protein